MATKRSLLVAATTYNPMRSNTLQASISLASGAVQRHGAPRRCQAHLVDKSLMPKTTSGASRLRPQKLHLATSLMPQSSRSPVNPIIQIWGRSTDGTATQFTYRSAAPHVATFLTASASSDWLIMTPVCVCCKLQHLWDVLLSNRWEQSQ